MAGLPAWPPALLWFMPSISRNTIKRMAYRKKFSRSCCTRAEDRCLFPGVEAVAEARPKNSGLPLISTDDTDPIKDSRLQQLPDFHLSAAVAQRDPLSIAGDGKHGNAGEVRGKGAGLRSAG